MSPSARRRSLSLRRILSAALCLGVVCSALCVKAQTKTPAAAATAAQPFDAVNLPGPAGLGAQGVVAGGDNPAFARSDFDDSRWVPIDATKKLGDVFPHSRPEIIWQRMHVKVNPAQTGMGLESYGISQAYEVYVNGQKLIESGRVDPFVRYTEDARIVVSIPDAMVKTGSLTIAVRARVLPRWWKGAGVSFPPDMISLGQQEALHDHAWSKIVGSQAIEWLLDCCGIVVCLVALALFTAQRRQYEYLWLSLLGAATFAEVPISVVAPFHSVPAALLLANSITNFVSPLLIILMVMAFVRQKLNRWLLASVVALTFVCIVAGQAAQIGMISPTFYQVIQIPYVITVAVLIPIVLLIHLRRGNREAGILLIPMIFWSLTTYAYVTVFLLGQIPALHKSATTAIQRMNSFAVGPFAIGFGNLTALLFFLTMAAIIVRRSTRMSRQQAVLEGEMAAAREVQQVILPEHAEAVPGFTVESVYQPAQQVGGDFFQILPDGHGGLLVVVGDVAGKGLSAAMLVSVLVGATRGVAEYTKDPCELLANLNERLVGRGGGGFSTALVAHISADGLVTIANAGHLSPYLDGSEVEMPGALPLGALSGAVYDATQFVLAPGSRLTFYSDGVVEAQNQKGELLGFERAKAISTQPAAAIVEAAKNFGQSDDITVVTIARAAPIAAVAGSASATIGLNYTSEVES